MTDAMTVEERVREALKEVMDPCSVYNGTKLSLFDLGMYQRITVDDVRVVIELMLDDPTCAYSGMIAHGLHVAVDPVVDGREVVLTMATDEYWSEARLTAHARARLEETRRIRRERVSQLRARREAAGVRRPYGQVLSAAADHGRPAEPVSAKAQHQTRGAGVG